MIKNDRTKTLSITRLPIVFGLEKFAARDVEKVWKSKREKETGWTGIGGHRKGIDVGNRGRN